MQVDGIESSVYDEWISIRGVRRRCYYSVELLMVWWCRGGSEPCIIIV